MGAVVIQWGKRWPGEKAGIRAGDVDPPSSTAAAINNSGDLPAWSVLPDREHARRYRFGARVRRVR